MGPGLVLWLLATCIFRISGADDGKCVTAPPSPRPAGEVVEHRGLNETQRALVVHLHNMARERVASGMEKRGNPGPQPSAANMNVLTWDEELASLAQSWADRGEFQHNPCRSTKNYGSVYPYIGENLHYQMSMGAEPSDFGWPKAVNDWYEEVVQWPNNQVSAYKFNSATGHYTQVAWAETKRVGCGFTSYLNGKTRSALYVCNYYPGGNVVANVVYKEGAPHSACPHGRHKRRLRKYQSLCNV